jgi:hypothetical protein
MLIDKHLKASLRYNLLQRGFGSLEQYRKCPKVDIKCCHRSIKACLPGL